jgi:hypothetical protein
VGRSAPSATRGGRRCVGVSECSVPVEEVTTGLAEDDDLDLIRRVAAQDRQAFEALYRRYAPDCTATYGSFFGGGKSSRRCSTT